MNSILSRTFARVALQKACSRPHAERWKETPLIGVIERNMFLWGRISSSKYLVEVIRALSALCPVLAFIVAGYVVHSFPGAWFSSIQFAFFLPTGTPSNIVGFAIEIKDMIKTGVPLKIAGIAALSFLLPTLGAYVFGTNGEVQ
uniref:Uncharacterized protein n=1 Tax=Populus trichocarpa TaxID=3694 RepID=A0A2K2ANS2_POPTR